jgi:flagellar assembly factor FliW
MTMTSTAMPASPRRTIATELFGTLDVAGQQVLEFAEGILGFPACKQWVLIDGSKPGTAWLQSLDHGPLAFLLIDPFQHFEGFSADLGAEDTRRIDAADASKVVLFAIVTLPASKQEQATANLQGPIVINVEARRGAQLVLSDSRWSIRQPFAMEKLA